MKLIGATLLFAYAVSARRNKNNKKKEPQQYNHTPCNANSHAVTSLGFANGFTTDSMLTPNYPQNYGDFECVQWTVSRPNGIPDGSIPTLVFNDFYVEEGYDFLYIYTGTTDDAANEVAKLDGRQAGQLVLPGDASDFYFKWDSDFSYSLTGFDIYVEWQAPPQVPVDWDNCFAVADSPVMSCGVIKVGDNKCASVGADEMVTTADCLSNDANQQWEFINDKIYNAGASVCWRSRNPHAQWGFAKRAPIKAIGCEPNETENKPARWSFASNGYTITAAEDTNLCVYGSLDVDAEPYVYTTWCNTGYFGASQYP